MPLSPPEAREPLHKRAIEINGYRRTDGLYDIEAQLTDTKSFGFANHDRGYIEAGEPLHGMWLRLTVDEKMHIVGCEAVSDHTPYQACPAAAPNFSRLVGLQIKAGFLREVNHRIQNSLQLVSSFLSLQMRGTEDPLVLAQLEEARRRLLAVALVHRRLYQSDQVQSVEMGRYVEELRRELVDSLGPEWNGHVQVRADTISVPTDQAAMSVPSLALSRLKTSVLPW